MGSRLHAALIPAGLRASLAGLLLLGSAALAAPPEAPAVARARAEAAAEVLAGEDLAAWALLSARRPGGAEAVAALRAFVARWPTSSLSEVAWLRLEALGGAAGVGETWAQAPEQAALVGEVAARVSERAAALARRESSAPAVVLVEIPSPADAAALAD